MKKPFGEIFSTEEIDLLTEEDRNKIDLNLVKDISKNENDLVVSLSDETTRTIHFKTFNGVDVLGEGDITKGDLGLGNVDNTSDINKPVSTAQAVADTTILNTAKSYADGLVVGLLDDRGSYNASVNTFPTSGGSGTSGAILKGDMWFISVAGTLDGQNVTVGDSIRALVDAPGQTATNWSIIDTNINYVPENNANKVTDVDAYKTSDTFYASVKAIYNWAIGLFYTKAEVNAIVGKVGTKNVDETLIADDTILVYKTASNQYVLEAKPSGAGETTGVNTGDETAARIGTLIGGSGDATPNNTDYIATSSGGILKKLTWTNAKAFLKTYFDTLYALTGHTHTGIYQPLDSVLTNTTASYTTTIDTRLTNTSGINSGDNATNTQYSGLAESKEDTANKAITMSGNTTSDIKFLSAKAIYDWAVGLLDAKDNLAITDSRGANRPPSYYDIKKVQWDFVQDVDVGLTGLGETWIALQTIKKWDSHNSAHKIYQFAYTGGLVSMRESTSDANWSAWWQIVDTKSNQSIGGVKDFTGVMKFAEAEWSGSYGVNIKFKNQGNQGFKVRNYNDEIVLEATEGGQVRTKNNHIVLYSDNSRIPRFEVTAKSDDNTKMKWVHFYDRDGAVIGADTYQIRAYPETSGGTVTDYASIMALNFNRGNGLCDINFPRSRNLYLNGKSLTSNGSDIFLNTGGTGQTITLRPNGEGNSGNQFEVSNSGLYFNGGKLPIGGVIKDIPIGTLGAYSNYTIAHGLSISQWEILEGRYFISIVGTELGLGMIYGYGSARDNFLNYNHWTNANGNGYSEVNWDGTYIRFQKSYETMYNTRLLIYKLF